MDMDADHDHNHGFDPKDILDAHEYSMCLVEEETTKEKGVAITMSRGGHCLRAVLDTDDMEQIVFWMVEALGGEAVEMSKDSAEQDGQL